MSREITYWLVINSHKYIFNGETEYYCLIAGKTSVTDNPKRAMRFHTEEGAQTQAHVLGWHWSAVERKFAADEPCL
jgi:hypothetical protein